MERPVLAIAIVSLMTVAAIDGCAKAVAEEPQTPSTQLELTVYKQDFGLVHEVRSVNLAAGPNQLRLPGVSKQLDPKSVMFDWEGASPKPDVVSTSYNLGVDSSQEMLKRLVGQKVDMVWRGQDGKIGDRVSGRLEQVENGTVLHTDKSYLIDGGGEVVAPGDSAIPTMPELVAGVQAPVARTVQMGLSYLTSGMSWSADYVGLIAPDGKSMRLECWSTIVNTTGTDFRSAKLNLVAGSPNRASSPSVPRAFLNSVQTTTDMSGFSANFGQGRQVTPTAVGELYTYRLPDRADVMQSQMNRARIFSADAVPIKRTYQVDLSEDMDSTKRQSANVSIAFVDGSKSGLGMPLPAGTLRTYEATGSGQAYTGAADIPDTPKSEKVKVTLSDAFDLYAKTRLVSEVKVGKHRAKKSFSVELHNDKKSDETIGVDYQFNSPVTVADQSLPGTKTNAATLHWDIPVPKEGRRTLTFSVVTGR